MTQAPTRRGMSPASPEVPASIPPGDPLLHQLLGLMRETYFETDLTGKLTHFNDYVCELHGRSADTLRQLDYRKFMSPADARRVYEVFNAVYRTGVPSAPIEYEIIRQDGGLTTVETTVALLRDGAEKPVGFCGISRNITDKKRTENALRESEHKHRSIIEHLEEGYYETDLEGRFTYFNPAVCRNLGYSVDELTGLSYRDFMAPETAEKTLAVFNQVFRTGQAAKIFACELLRKDGSTCVHEISVSPLRNAAGEPIGFYGISRDRTEAQLMEKALEESEASYREILAAAPYSITIQRRSDLVFVEVNEAFVQRTGYSPAETIGKTARDLKLFDDPAIRLQVLGALETEGHLDAMEIRFRDRAGAVIESLLSARPIRFRGEDCFLFVTTEITALKAVQRALAKSEEKYRNILKNMEEGYYEVDLRGTFTFTNPAMGSIFGRPHDQLVGMNLRQYTRRGDLARIRAIYNQIFRSGNSARVMDYTIMRKDGSQGIIEASAALLRDISGAPIGFYGIARDVTERKRAEEALHRYRDQLEEMVRERTQALERAQSELVRREKLSVLGQLTATVSHELRNPLGVIRSSNFYLKRRIQSNDPKIDKHFSRIDEQVAVCDAIVSDLLEYTRGRNLDPDTVELHPWLEQVLEQQEEKAEMRFERRLAPDLPPVDHDREKMTRVVVNVLENAVQAVRTRLDSPTAASASAYNPRIWVSTATDESHLVLTIADNGIGMDPPTLNRAFEPLFTTRARGTGIGLAIVQKIVAEHDGGVALESTPGEGTTVTIRLPLKRKHA